MTNSEIMEKVIGKLMPIYINGKKMVDFMVAYEDRIQFTETNWEEYYAYSFYDVIFSHDFARKFWGEKKVCKICGEPKNEIGVSCNECLTYVSEDEEEFYYIPEWQFRLTIMVLEEEPIKYLEGFLDG